MSTKYTNNKKCGDIQPFSTVELHGLAENVSMR
jgi:hypothetical protein